MRESVPNYVWFFVGWVCAFLFIAVIETARGESANVDTRISAGVPGNCTSSFSRPVVVTRWRTYKSGVPGLWRAAIYNNATPKKRFNCLSMGITEETRTQASKIFLDTEDAGTFCIIGACPQL